MVLNATFNNILVISWWSVVLVEETGENQRLKIFVEYVMYTSHRLHAYYII